MKRGPEYRGLCSCSKGDRDRGRKGQEELHGAGEGAPGQGRQPTGGRPEAPPPTDRRRVRDRRGACCGQRLKAARECLPCLSHLWVDAGYQSRGKEWAEQELGISVEVVHRTPKPIPEKIAMIWAEEWAKEGKEVDWQKLLPRRGFEVLPRCWVVERIFSWLNQNRRVSKVYERLCATGETFIYAAMSRLMVRRLARA